jgi:RNA polymerase sigma-70 factor (ECF subfamily)
MRQIARRSRPEGAVPIVDFADLYREHAADVRRFALYLSGDAALADDLVSEVFVRVWTARDRVDLTTVRAYLFAIVRNLFLKHRRDQGRRLPLNERMATGEPDPERRMSDLSNWRAVVASLAKLPEIDRAALLMRADEGLPYEEIAAALGISTAAAKVKVHRSRLKLAGTLTAVPAGTGKEQEP